MLIAIAISAFYFKPDVAIPDEHPVREFNVTVKQFEYNPNVLRVKFGERVVVHLKNLDVTHGFGIFEYGISVEVLPNETVTVSFIADKRGTFVIYCTVFCGTGHPNHKGTLIVE